MAFSHKKIETRHWLLVICTLFIISLGGLVEIVPLFFQRTTTEPAPGVQPYGVLELAGRDVYQREGCYTCHSQMIRSLRSDTLRYGPYSVAGEFVYDHPFQWGSKRTGPDLARVGTRYSDEWHRQHLIAPRSLVPQSNMPAFPWLETAPLDGARIAERMTALRKIGVPYTDEQIASAEEVAAGKTELDAMVAYLQGLGVARK